MILSQWLVFFHCCRFLTANYEFFTDFCWFLVIDFPIVDFWLFVCPLPTADCFLLTADCWLLIADCRSLIVHSWLVAYLWLTINDRQLLIFFIAGCLLSIVDCQLSIVVIDCCLLIVDSQLQLWFWLCSQLLVLFVFFWRHWHLQLQIFQFFLCVPAICSFNLFLTLEKYRFERSLPTHKVSLLYSMPVSLRWLIFIQLFVSQFGTLFRHLIFPSFCLSIIRFGFLVCSALGCSVLGDFCFWILHIFWLVVNLIFHCLRSRIINCNFNCTL